MLDFWERFPLQLVVAVYCEESLTQILRANGLSNTQAWKHIEEAYGRVRVDISAGDADREERLYWQARITVLGIQDAFCHALATDKTCSIYDERPRVCQLFPIVSEGPDRSAGRDTRDALQKLQRLLQYECDTGPTAPVAVKDAAVPAHAVQIRAQIVQDRKALNNILRPHPVIANISKLAADKLLRDGLPHYQWHTSIGPVIWTMWQQDLFDETEFERLMTRQAELVRDARQRAIDGGTKEVPVIDSVLQDYETAIFNGRR